MILQRVEQSEWLSNAYLIVDRPGGRRRAGRLERRHGPAGRAGRTRGHRDHPRPAHPPPFRSRDRRREARRARRRANRRARALRGAAQRQGDRDDRRRRRGRVRRAADRGAAHARSLPGPPRAARRRDGLPHRRRAVQGNGRRHARRRPQRVRRIACVRDGAADEAGACYSRPSRPPRPLDDRRGMGREPVRASVARPRRRGLGAVLGRSAGRRGAPAGDARPVGARLRRREQGVGSVPVTARTRSSAGRR